MIYIGYVCYQETHSLSYACLQFTFGEVPVHVIKFLLKHYQSFHPATLQKIRKIRKNK